MHRSCVLIAGFALLSSACAQKTPPEPAPTGTVTGIVICADTQRPARLAEISLVRKPDEFLMKAQPSNKPDPKHPVAMLLLNGRTGLDGSYTIRDVPLGDYYVLAKMPGYVLPLGKIENDKQAKDVDTVMRAVPLVHVTADNSATVDISLTRGGMIAGRLQFEDGTPVVGMWVKVEPAEGDDHDYMLQPYYLAQAVGYVRNHAQTDDDGRFRIASLAPGKYVVTSQLQVEGGMQMSSDGKVASGPNYQMLNAYAPGVFRKPDAKVYEIHAGDQFTDANVEIALDRLHTVRGRVLAKEDRHRPDHVGISLTDATDKDFTRWSAIAADGSFHFDYIPEGTYAIDTFAAGDADSDHSPGKPVRHYADLKTSVIVLDKDVTLDDLLLDAVTPAKDGSP